MRPAACIPNPTLALTRAIVAVSKLRSWIADARYVPAAGAPSPALIEPAAAPIVLRLELNAWPAATTPVFSLTDDLVVSKLVVTREVRLI